MANNTNPSDGAHHHPPTLEGALRFAIENTPQSHEENAAGESMTEERREFLRAALSQLTGSRPVDRMKEILANLYEYLQSKTNIEEGEDCENLYQGLDELIEWCYCIDLACDFHKINGFSLLPLLQNSKDDELKWRCGELIAVICQNNPYCQQHILEDTDQLVKLMNISKSCDESPTVRVKALYALSGLLNGYNDAINAFVNNSGYDMLFKLMEDSSIKISTKATYLLIAIMREESGNRKDEITKMGALDTLIFLLSTEHNEQHEHFMCALLELFTNNPTALDEARKSNINLQNFLSIRMETLRQDPADKEELDYGEQIMKILGANEDQVIEK